MSKLPTRLQPFWPLLKRAHRMLSLVLGLMFRPTARLIRNGVPTTATTWSEETAAREPSVVIVHPGGPEERIERPTPTGRPERHWRFVAAQRSLVPSRYTLEVLGGDLMGDFGATVTPGGVLDYQTSGYFGIASWREHPLFLSPTRGRVEKVAGTVLSLTTRGAAVNYYHFLYDAVARYGIFEESMPGEGIDAIVVPHEATYQRALLDLAGIRSDRLIQPCAGVTVRAERLLVPSTPNQALDAPAWVVGWLRNRLLAGERTAPATRLYLTRGNTPNTRRYLQEDELWPWLEDEGFRRVDPGALPVQDQIALFDSAEVVVAPHGAGLTNITFCQPGTHVLEMFAPNYVHLGLWTIAHAAGLDYSYLVGDGRHDPGQPMRGNYSDVSIPASVVKDAVRGMVT